MTADDIRTRLDEIDAYCAAATPGPWERGDWHVWSKANGGRSVEVCPMGGPEHRADGGFIAAARMDLPAVVAALRDALAEVERLRGIVVRDDGMVLACDFHLVLVASDGEGEAREACPACEAQVAGSRLGDATAQIRRMGAERDALAAEVERWVDAHAVLAREVDELRRALSVDDLAAHDEARAEELAPRITAAMLGAYGLGRDDEAAGNPVRTPLDIVENSLPADVPMSSNKGHDLRERIAQRIDQAWAVAKDRLKRAGLDEYLDGYLTGLEYAEGIARSTPLTEVGEES